MAKGEIENDKSSDENQPSVILIAYLQAHLVSGATVDLLPIRHENDVKSDVTKLLEEWAESGFLLRGNIAYPWHQVKHVEVIRVEELPPHEVHQRMLELEGSARAQMQNGFWKTRGKPAPANEKKPEGQDGAGSQHPG